MRTNVDNLANAEYNTQLSSMTEATMGVIAFKVGFNKCLSLVKPLLDKAIEDFKDEYGDNEDYKYTYEKIQEFLEKYEQ